MYRQKIDLSNDVSFVEVVHVVNESRHERQYIVFTPRIVTALLSDFISPDLFFMHESIVYSLYR